jgi:type I restriction enzyme M protein
LSVRKVNFQAADRIARLKDESGFKNLASSNKKKEKARLEEIKAGQKRQEQIHGLLRAFTLAHGEKIYKERKIFLTELREIDRRQEVRLKASEVKSVLSALGERDETAEICRDKDDKPEPDSELRDTESVPLNESIAAYFRREVLPPVPDAWIDETKTNIGYAMPLNPFLPIRAPRPLEVIEADIKTL